MGPATEDSLSDEPPMLVVDIRSLKAARSAPVLVVATENAACKEEAALQHVEAQPEAGDKPKMVHRIDANDAPDRVWGRIRNQLS